MTFVSGLSVGTSWTKYTYTATIPSISGKTFGTNENDSLDIYFFLPINTTFTFDVAQIQLEAGSVATPFEQRPFGMELALCQRYYYDCGNRANSVMFYNLNATNANGFASYPVTMRATPVVTIYDSSTLGKARNNSANSQTTVTAVAVNSIYGLGAFQMTGGVMADMSIFNYTASAEL